MNRAIELLALTRMTRTCARGGAIAAVVAVGLFAGCKRQGDVYSYDPKVDSILPPAISGVDMSILEDQKSRPRPVVTADVAAPARGAATRPAATTSPAGGPESGGSTAPAAPAEGGGTPPPPPVTE
jgi:hypothetical protein